MVLVVPVVEVVLVVMVLQAIARVDHRAAEHELRFVARVGEREEARQGDQGRGRAQDFDAELHGWLLGHNRTA